MVPTSARAWWLTATLLLLASLVQAATPPPNPERFKDGIWTEPVFRWSSCGKGAMPCETFTTPKAAYDFMVSRTGSSCGTVTFGPMTPWGNSPVDGRYSVIWSNYVNVSNPKCGAGWDFDQTADLVYYCLEGFTAVAWPEASGGQNYACYKPAPVKTSCNRGCDGLQSMVFGNPVSLADRVKSQAETDVRSVGPNGLAFVRQYRSDTAGFVSSYGASGVNSGTSAPAFDPQSDASPSPTGCYPGFFRDLNKNGPEAPLEPGCARLFKMWEDSYVRRGADGDYTQFWKSAANMVAGAGAVDQLVTRQADGRSMVRTVDALELYGTTGLLLSRQLSNGPLQTMTYSNASTPTSIAPRPDLLIEVANGFGASLQFRYDARGHLRTLVDQAGKEVTYTVDNGGNVTEVLYPDGSRKQYLYNEPAYAPAGPPPQLLTGIVDETGQRFASFAYDAAGKAVSTEHAGGVERYVLSDGNTVTFPNNEQRLYVTQSWGSFKAPQELRRTWTCTGCTAPQTQVARFGLDVANGNTLSYDDFQGNRKCFAYEATRNLVAVRVEGLGTGADCASLTKDNATLPKGSRKIATAWHPDWRLETKRTEPRRITLYVYNGQPDPLDGNKPASCAPAAARLPDGKPIAVLCKKVERASTDSTGSAGLAAVRDGGVPDRFWAYTYNAAGQVLSGTDPLGRVTKYAYYEATTVDYTKGDLRSVTNPASQVTTFTKYNKHGQVLESSDPNKLLTVYTYDDRQRLKSASVGGLLTTYDYWPNGLLKQVTQPDASFLSYEYDAAQRLRVVKDQLGNRVDYTSDNAGNNKTEAVTDPSGALRRQLKRGFDQLNRLQQITGRE